MRYWVIKKINNDYVIVPKEPLYSPFSSEPLLLHDFRVYKAAQGFYHADIHMKDPVTDWWTVFGVPISQEEYELLRKSRYHGRILICELKQLYPSLDKRIEERLRRWGYW